MMQAEGEGTGVRVHRGDDRRGEPVASISERSMDLLPFRLCEVLELGDAEEGGSGDDVEVLGCCGDKWRGRCPEEMGDAGAMAGAEEDEGILGIVVGEGSDGICSGLPCFDKLPAGVDDVVVRANESPEALGSVDHWVWEGWAAVVVEESLTLDGDDFRLGGVEADGVRFSGCVSGV